MAACRSGSGCWQWQRWLFCLLQLNAALTCSTVQVQTRIKQTIAAVPAQLATVDHLQA